MSKCRPLLVCKLRIRLYGLWLGKEDVRTPTLTPDESADRFSLDGTPRCVTCIDFSNSSVQT